LNDLLARYEWLKIIIIVAEPPCNTWSVYQSQAGSFLRSCLVKIKKFGIRDLGFSNPFGILFN
jgi:hypothetical protein